jgi:hypothetical protein
VSWDRGPVASAKERGNDDDDDDDGSGGSVLAS